MAAPPGQLIALQAINTLKEAILGYGDSLHDLEVIIANRQINREKWNPPVHICTFLWIHSYVFLPLVKNFCYWIFRYQ